MTRLPRRAASASVLTAALAAAVLLGACGREAPPVEAPAVSIEAVTVSPRDFVVSYRGPASLEAWKTSDLGAEPSGRIRWMGAEEGDSVRAGQEIVRIEAAVQEARAGEAAARIADAEVALESARTNLERVRRLHREGVASRQEIEGAEALHARAGEAVAAARASAEAAGGEAAKMTIRAPFDGVVTMREHEVGEIVGAAARIYRVEDLSAIKAVVAVPEVEVGGIAVGARAMLRLADGETVTGAVSYVSPAADDSSRAVKVEIRVVNAGRRLRSGGFAEAEIIREVRRGALLVPRAALLQVSDGRGILYAVEGAAARKREVRLGGSDDYLFQVVEGLAAGDRIAVSGVAQLADGVRVRVIGEEPGAGETAAATTIPADTAPAPADTTGR